MCVNQKEYDGDEVEEGGKYDSDFFSTKSKNGLEDLPGDNIPEAETIVDRYNVPTQENIFNIRSTTLSRSCLMCVTQKEDNGD